jgi:hypothetical protein
VIGEIRLQDVVRAIAPHRVFMRSDVVIVRHTGSLPDGGDPTWQSFRECHKATLSRQGWTRQCVDETGVG